MTLFSQRLQTNLRIILDTTNEMHCVFILLQVEILRKKIN